MLRITLSKFCDKAIDVLFSVIETDPEIADHYKDERRNAGETSFGDMRSSSIESSFDREGRLLLRMVNFGGVGFEMYPENVVPGTGLRFRPGDLVTMNWPHYSEKERVFVVDGTPSREDGPQAAIWENHYSVAGIGEHGECLCDHRIHEHRLKPFDGEVSEPMRALSRLFKDEIMISDEIWKRLCDGGIDFSDRMPWRQALSMEGEPAASSKEER